VDRNWQPSQQHYGVRTTQQPAKALKLHKCRQSLQHSVTCTTLYCLPAKFACRVKTAKLHTRLDVMKLSLFKSVYRTTAQLSPESSPVCCCIQLQHCCYGL
jgi:hypothetical protein